MRFLPEITTNDKLHILAGHIAFWLRRLRDGNGSPAHLKEEYEDLQNLYLVMASDDPLLERQVWGSAYVGKTLGTLLEDVMNAPVFNEMCSKEQLQSVISDLFGIYRATDDGLCVLEPTRNHWLAH